VEEEGEKLVVCGGPKERSKCYLRLVELNHTGVARFVGSIAIFGQCGRTVRGVELGMTGLVWNCFLSEHGPGRLESACSVCRIGARLEVNLVDLRHRDPWSPGVYRRRRSDRPRRQGLGEFSAKSSDP
jgi:hypothetical protein